MAAISHLSQPVAIFPRGPARHLPEGRRPRHSLASNDGNAYSRCGVAHGCDPSLSQSARLTVRLLKHEILSGNICVEACHEVVAYCSVAFSNFPLRKTTILPHLPIIPSRRRASSRYRAG